MIMHRDTFQDAVKEVNVDTRRGRMLYFTMVRTDDNPFQSDWIL